MKSGKLSLLLLLSLAALVAGTPVASWATDVSGSVSGVWSPANSPYIVTGDLTVDAGDTLSIEAGVEVRFASAVGMDVYGDLEVTGTEADPVVFTSSASDPAPGAWRGLAFFDGSGGILQNCSILFAGYWVNPMVVVHGGAAPVFDTCTLARGQNDAFFMENQAHPSITHCQILDADWPVHAATNACLPAALEGNTYENIQHFGIRIDDPNVAEGSTATWTAYPDGLPYAPVGTVGIGADGDLSIDPGVIVKMENAASITVSGSLHASGTADLPIVLTANTDDMGGDTNGDGIAGEDEDAASPAPGYWSTIDFQDGSDGTLENCRILFAGYWVNPVVAIHGGAAPVFDGCSLGLGQNDAFFMENQAHPSITHCQIQDADWPVHAATNACLPAALEGNTYENIQHFGIRIDDPNVAEGSTATWTAYPDGLPYAPVGTVGIGADGDLSIDPGVIVKMENAASVSVSGSLSAVGTADLPIVFTANTDDMGGDTNGDGIAGEDEDAASPAPGYWSTIDFQDGSDGTLENCRILFAGYWVNPMVAVHGGAAPVFDTCTLAQGQNDAFFMENQAHPSITHCQILDADWPVHAATNACLPAALEGNTYENIQHFGIRIDDPNVAEGSTATWTAYPDGLPYAPYGTVGIAAGGDLSIAPGVIVKMENAASITVSGSLHASGTADLPIVFTANTHDMGGDTNGDGIAGEDEDAASPAPGYWSTIDFQDGSDGTLENCRILFAGYWVNPVVAVHGGAAPVFDGCTLGLGQNDAFFMENQAHPSITHCQIQDADWPVHAATNACLPAALEGNTYENIQHFGIRIDHPNVAADSMATWAAYPDSLPYAPVGTVVIDAGGDLSIDPGVIVKMENAASITVSGSLSAVGTADLPIVFTASTDDIRGDTNGDGIGGMDEDAASPAPGYWSTIDFQGGSDGTLQNCRILFAGYWVNPGVSVRGDAAPVICHTEIAEIDGDGIDIFDAGAPVVSPDVAFGDLTGLAINNQGSSIVDATNDWWGDPSGPHHATLNPAGAGYGVSDRVEFAPFLTQLPAAFMPPPPMPLPGMQLTLTPPNPTAKDTVAFMLEGALPFAEAEITDLSSTLQDSLIILELTTDWAAAPADTATTPFSLQDTLGQLLPGDYQLQVVVNGQVLMEQPFMVEQPPMPSLEEWLASDEAADLNSDGNIDEDDYDLFLAQQIMSQPPMPMGPVQLTLTPPQPSPQDTVTFGLEGFFPFAEADITDYTVSVQDSLITLELTTDWAAAPADTATTPFAFMDTLGQLAPGNYQIDVVFNGEVWYSTPFMVNEIIRPPTFEEWLASDEAADLNDDGNIDEDDYDLFLAQQIMSQPPMPIPGMQLTLTPPNPTAKDTVAFMLEGAFPFAEAEIQDYTSTLQDSLIILELTTDWAAALADTATTPFSLQDTLGQLMPGDHLLQVVVNGQLLMEQPFMVQKPPMPTFEEWLASDEADDLNHDGNIDEDDYDLFLAQQITNEPPFPTGSVQLTLLPSDPTADDSVAVRMEGAFPFAEAEVTDLQASTTDSLITIQVSTGWSAAPVDTATTPFSAVAPLGLLGAGAYHLDVVFNGETWSSMSFIVQEAQQASPVAWQVTLHVHDAGTGEDAGSGDRVFGQAAGATDGLDSDLGELEAPPSPPAGSFDVRFQASGLNGLLSDYRDSSLTTATWAVVFAPGPGGYPITLSWDRQALPENASLHIKDLYDGLLGLDIDMAAQDSLEITNTQFTGVHIVMTPAGGACQHTYELPAGWSMISLPCQMDDASVSALFPSAISVFGFENGYTPSDTLRPASGYWINMPDTATVEISGQAYSPSQLTASLPSGWSMIGPGGQEVTVSSLGSSVISVFGFANGYTPSDTLNPGSGYWINLSASGPIDLSGSQGAAAKTVAAGTHSQEPGDRPLLWVDAVQGTQTVALGVNPSEVRELPPLPPAGSFDARVVLPTGAGALSVPAGDDQAAYPVRVQGDVQRIRWQVPADQLGTWQLVVDGKPVDLDAAGSVELTPDARLEVRRLGALPEGFSLDAIYPNPFNSSAVIPLRLGTDEHVRVDLYNLLGQRILTLFDGRLSRGVHRLHWSGLDAAGHSAATGQYICRVQAGDQVEQRSMLLLR